ncbi:TPR domain-containing protein [groundwater metagenome]
MTPKTKYYCKSCNQVVSPIKKQMGFLFFKREQQICPICKKTTIVEMDEQIRPSSSNITMSEEKQVVVKVPSLSEFLKFYKAKDYSKAIGASPNSTPEEIRDAIDRFEMEHLDESGKWSIPMAKMKEALLKPNTKSSTEPRDEKQKEKKKAVDLQYWKKAEAILSEAKLLEDSGKLEGAIEMCTRAIEVAPSFANAYKKRAWICLLLPNYQQYLDQVIQDCTKVIEIEPDNALAYNDRGRAYIRKGDLENAIFNYGKALTLEPSLTIAALNKISAEIILGRYKDAVGTYGEWRRDVVSPKQMVIASSLICIALALDGKSYEDYTAPLLDRKIRIKYLHDWNYTGTDRYLAKIDKEGYFSDRVIKAKEIQDSFKEHFE